MEGPAVVVDGRPEVAAALLATGRSEAWLDRFARELDHRRAVGQLDHLRAVWGLTKAEAAQLFGVSRQAFGKWAAKGVPAAHQAAVADLAAASDLLVRHLRRERIAGVVRRPFAAAGGRNLLQVAADDPALARRVVREMFDVARVHR